MRPIRSFLDFKERVGEENLSKLTESFHLGFGDSVRVINFGSGLDVPVQYEMRSKACLAHDHIKSRVDNIFKDDNSVEIKKWNGIFGIKLGDDFLMRIKKFLKGGEVSCIMTFQQKSFNNQRLIKGFPDYPTFITLGYYPNQTWTGILGVYAACWTANGLLWFNKIGGGNEGFTQLEIEFPKPVDSTPTKRRVLPKEDPEKKTGTGTI